MARTVRTTGEYRAGCSKRSSSKAAAEEQAAGVPSLGYVEDLFKVRTKLADFFSILLTKSLAVAAW